MTKIKDLIKIKTFFSAERRAISTLEPPEDFAARLHQLAADYDLREQALAAAPPAEPAPPLPIPAPRLKPHYRRQRLFSPAMLTAVGMAALIIFAIGLTLPGSFGLPPRFMGLVEIKAAYAAGTGIDASQGFIISASQPLPADLVEKSLRVYPQFAYQLEEEDANTYRVLPLEPLEQNTVYHLSFDPERVQEDKPIRAEYSWSFQTEPAFALTDISPSDTANQVPAAAALSLAFNKEVHPQAADFILIEPAIEGSWQAEGAVLSFIPAEGWDYDARYSVILTAGLPAADGSTLKQEQFSRFQTEPPPAPAFIFDVQNTQALFKPEEIPAWALVERVLTDDSPYNLTLYTLPDAQAYAQLLQDGLEGDIAFTEAPENFELAPTLTEEGQLTLSLEQNLSSGFYLAVIEKQDSQRRLLFQVSGLDAYVSHGKAQRLFWLHDELGLPLVGAGISLWPDGAEQGYTDEQGLAVLNAAENTPRKLVYCIETEQQALIISTEDKPAAAPPPPSCFRHTLYTDQSYYSPGQTVSFFGVCLPHAGGPPLSEQLTVRLKGMVTDAPLPYQATVTAGAFSGSLSLPGLHHGWYELALYAGETYIGGRYIQVGPQSPYRLELQALDEEENWLVTFCHRDGSPLSGIELMAEGISSGTSMRLRSDEQGQAMFSLPGAEIRVTATLPAQEQVSAYAYRQAEDAADRELPKDDTLRLLAGEMDQRYQAAEPVELNLYQNGESLPAAYADDTLFVLAGEHILAQAAGVQAQATLAASGDYPAEFYAWAICYQQGQYIESMPLLLKGAPPPAAQLELEWQPAEEETVAAKDALHLSLQLKDAYGLPFAATLNISLSEQAPAGDDFALTLQGGDMYWPILAALPAAAAADSPQSTALFFTVATDEQGRAEVEITPPAGGPWFISWRAWSAEQSLAAAGTLELDTRPPLSILSHFAESLAAGDEAVLRLNATGAKVDAGDAVSYEISLPEQGFKRSVSVEAGRWYEVKLPALQPGTYELLLSARSGPHRATLLLPFTVRAEQIYTYALKQQPLKDNTSLDEAKNTAPVLILSGQDKATAIAEIFALTQRDTARLDYRLAALTAARLLERDFGWKEALTNLEPQTLPLYQREDGGLAPLPQAATNIRLSAMAAPLIKEDINRPALAAYLRLHYQQAETTEEQALALYGLAGLEQPVLLDIEQMLANNPSSEAKLYLALAYFASGHGAAAKTLAVELLSTYNEKAPLPEDTTAYLALLANVFELPQAQSLSAALTGNSYATVLAEAQILAARCRTAPPNGYFSYQLNGQLHQIRLREHGHYLLALSPQQLTELAFSDVAGDVVLSIISLQPSLPTKPASLSITRSYQQQPQHGLVEIQLDISLPEEAPPGYYRIEDTLAAGLRFGALDRQASSRQSRLLKENGPALSFIIYKDEGAYQGILLYKARVYMPGNYHMAAPNIRSLRQPELFGSGEKQTIEIR